VLKENEEFENNLENELGYEIMEHFALETRAHQSRLSRNENYSRFIMRMESFLMFLEDMTNMGILISFRIRFNI
jgi:ribonuclease PH